MINAYKIIDRVVYNKSSYDVNFIFLFFYLEKYDVI